MHDPRPWGWSGNVEMSITRQSQVVSSLTNPCVLTGDRQRLDLQQTEPGAAVRTPTPAPCLLALGGLSHPWPCWLWPCCLYTFLPSLFPRGQLCEGVTHAWRWQCLVGALEAVLHIPGVGEIPGDGGRCAECELLSELPVLLIPRRYFELCFGEVRIRTDLQKGPAFQPSVPEAPREADGNESRTDLTLKPSLLRLLSQVRHWLGERLLWAAPLSDIPHSSAFPPALFHPHGFHQHHGSARGHLRVSLAHPGQPDASPPEWQWEEVMLCLYPTLLPGQGVLLTPVWCLSSLCPTQQHPVSPVM